MRRVSVLLFLNCIFYCIYFFNVKFVCLNEGFGKSFPACFNGSEVPPPPPTPTPVVVEAGDGVCLYVHDLIPAGVGSRVTAEGLEPCYMVYI